MAFATLNHIRNNEQIGNVTFFKGVILYTDKLLIRSMIAHYKFKTLHNNDNCHNVDLTTAI